MTLQKKFSNFFVVLRFVDADDDVDCVSTEGVLLKGRRGTEGEETGESIA